MSRERATFRPSPKSERLLDGVPVLDVVAEWCWFLKCGRCYAQPLALQ